MNRKKERNKPRPLPDIHSFPNSSTSSLVIPLQSSMLIQLLKKKKKQHCQFYSFPKWNSIKEEKESKKRLRFPWQPNSCWTIFFRFFLGHLRRFVGHGKKRRLSFNMHKGETTSRVWTSLNRSGYVRIIAKSSITQLNYRLLSTSSFYLKKKKKLKFFFQNWNQFQWNHLSID